ncbi:MAG TPA: hypothetical protein VL125_09685 [Pelobium sp.]|nr:hypothetical protein [Pelobium sp.]
MKIFSFLFALVVLVLSFVPDTSVPIQKQATTTLSVGKSYFQQIDELCSPFFPCSGCIAPILNTVFRQETPLGHFVIVTYKKVNTAKLFYIPFVIWQPPQIG